MVFVLLLLATVTFDGFMATPPWSTVESTLYAVAPGSPDFKLTIVATVGLIGFAVLFVAVYRAFAVWIARAGGRHSPPAVGSRVRALADPDRAGLSPRALLDAIC